MPARCSRSSGQAAATLVTFAVACLGLLSSSSSSGGAAWAFVHSKLERCEPIDVPRCRAMPYNMTRMPNLLHHNTQENARLAFEQFHVLLDQNCSHVLLFLLCAMYVPICTVAFQPDPIPPCRDVCERARAGCEPLMRAYNHSWPEALSCANLPRYERGVCVSPEAIITPSMGKKRCACKKKKQKVKSMLRKHQYDYAVHAKLVKLTRTDPKTVTLKIHVEEVLFCGHVRFPRSNHVTLWMNSSCACPKLRQGRQYLLAGHEDVATGRLLFSPSSALGVQWRNKWSSRVKRWHQQVGKNKPIKEAAWLTSSAAMIPRYRKHDPRGSNQEDEEENANSAAKLVPKQTARTKEQLLDTKLERMNSNLTER